MQDMLVEKNKWGYFHYTAFQTPSTGEGTNSDAPVCVKQPQVKRPPLFTLS